MKIELDGKVPFFQAYHASTYIVSHDDRNVVTLKEPRESRIYKFKNVSKKELVVYKIDGGLISDNAVQKCDFAILTEDDVLFLIELKGADYIHALQQLLSTISTLLLRPQIMVQKLNARVVLSKIRVPDIMTTQEKKLRFLLKTCKGDLLRKCQVLEESY